MASTTMNCTTCVNSGFVPPGTVDSPLVNKAKLIMGLGNQGKPDQWYLKGTDITGLPNPTSGTPLADSIVLEDRGYWKATGEIFTVLGQNVSAATIGLWSYFTVLQDWNSVKNIRLTSTEADRVQTNGFVHVDVDLGRRSLQGSDVNIIAGKRGTVTTGKGGDIINIAVASNEQTWINEFHINSGAGHDKVKIEAFDLAKYGCQDPYKNLAPGFLMTDGAWQRISVDLGSGNDLFDSTGVKTRDFVKAGSGNDVVATGGGNDRVDGGYGIDQINGGSGNDILDAGESMVYGRTYEAFCSVLYSNTSTQYANSAKNFYTAIQKTAEVVVGGSGNDVLISSGPAMPACGCISKATSDGTDIFTGGAGADKFYFENFWGFDIVKDFVGGAASSNGAANAGDRLFIDGYKAGSSLQLGLYKVNVDGSNDDLMVVLFKGGDLAASAKTSIVLEDFFTLNQGVINTAGYVNKLLTADQVAALGANSIFSTSQAEHDALKAQIGANFYA